MLKDEGARSRLLLELERLSAQKSGTPATPTTAAPATGGGTAPAAAPAPQQDTSLARELSEYTQEVGRDAVAVVLKAGTACRT